jgi:hypothetical protein
VEAWKISVKHPDNKTRLAVEVAVHLQYGPPLKIKERVIDPAEFGVNILKQDDGVEQLLEFMESKVFYNDPMTDRYKLWQDLTKLMKDKNQTMTAYITSSW